jgi:hypothetical protein
MNSDPIPSARAPLYVCEVDEPVVLYQGEGVLVADGNSEKAECIVRYAWRPSEGPEVYFPDLAAPPTGDCALEVPAIGLKADVSVRVVKVGSAVQSFVGLLRGLIRTGQHSGLASLTFHLGNFPFVIGEAVERGTSIINGRIHLEHSPWAIDIDPVPDDPDHSLMERLRETKGRSITHAGTLARQDRSAFAVADAEPVLRDVSRTLSLARAAFSTPLLLTGVDTNGKAIWRCWSAYRTDAWQSHRNWFSTMHPATLQSVFSGWRSVSAGPDAEVISAAQHLYLDAHDTTLALESRLVLAQAALEGVADGWQYPALAGSPTLPTFGSPAAERIAKVAVSVGLPVDVPKALTALAALKQPKVNAPALDKMAWVRNSVAHLGNFPRLVGQSSRMKFEAFELGGAHLELAVLRLLDAKGPYVDRLSSSPNGKLHKKFAWEP